MEINKTKYFHAVFDSCDNETSVATFLKTVENFRSQEIQDGGQKPEVVYNSGTVLLSCTIPKATPTLLALASSTVPFATVSDMCEQW